MNTKLKKTYRKGCLVGAGVWIAAALLGSLAARAVGDPLLPWVTGPPGPGDMVWRLSTATFFAGAAAGFAAMLYYLIVQARVPYRYLAASAIAVLILLVFYGVVALQANSEYQAARTAEAAASATAPAEGASFPLAASPAIPGTPEPQE